MTMATWLGMPKSLTLVFSHLMKDLPPKPVNVEQIIGEEHAREMPDIDNHPGCGAYS